MFSTYSEEPEVAPSWATELAREGHDEENSFNRGHWVYNAWRPGFEKGNPGKERFEGGSQVYTGDHEAAPRRKFWRKLEDDLEVSMEIRA